MESNRAQLPIGTPVMVILDGGERWHTKTRSLPWQLGHGQWVVLLEGKVGGYDCARVSVAVDYAV